MKNRLIVSIVFGIFVATLAFTAISSAEDVMMNITVKSISDGVDKKGDAYKRIVFTEPAELNGIKYERQSMIMVFSDAIDQLEGVEAGAALKMIVNKGDYKGRPSYALLAVVR